MAFFKTVYSMLFLEIVHAWRHLKMAWCERMLLFQCFASFVVLVQKNKEQWSGVALVGIVDRQTYALSREPSLNPQCWNMMLILLLYFSSGSAELMGILLYTHVPFYLFDSQKGTYNNSCIISWKRDFRMAWEDCPRKFVLFFHSLYKEIWADCVIEDFTYPPQCSSLHGWKCVEILIVH